MRDERKGSTTTLPFYLHNLALSRTEVVWFESGLLFSSPNRRRRGFSLLEALPINRRFLSDPSRIFVSQFVLGQLSSWSWPAFWSIHFCGTLSGLTSWKRQLEEKVWKQQKRKPLNPHEWKRNQEVRKLRRYLEPCARLESFYLRGGKIRSWRRERLNG